MPRLCSRVGVAGVLASVLLAGAGSSTAAANNGPRLTHAAVATAGIPVSTITSFGDALPRNEEVVGGVGITSDPNGGILVASAAGQLRGDQYYYPDAPLAAPIVGLATSAGGAWMAASDGGVFTAGNAGFFGSLGRVRLAKPVVGIAATPDGGGYWMVGSDGGVFTFGDAGFLGSLGRVRLAEPIVGIAATATGEGYWLVAADGGVFAFGDARFFGSLGSVRLARPIVGIAATTDDGGYWLVGADGGVFTFGDARFYGSLAKSSSQASAVGLARTGDGRGYWILSAPLGQPADAAALVASGFTPVDAAAAPLANGEVFSEISAVDARTSFLAVFFYVGTTEVASTVPQPGLETVPPGEETGTYPRLAVAGTGLLLSGYDESTYTYTWTGTAVSTTVSHY